MVALMLPKKMVKIICIVLAALMMLSAVAVLIQVFASDAATITTVAPKTGDNDLDTIVPIVLIVAAVLAIGACLLLPKLKKKG